MESLKLSGKIKKGKIKLSGVNDLNEFLSCYEGHNIIYNLTILPKKNPEKMIAYFYGLILPELQKKYHESGERKFLDEIERELLLTYPFTDYQEKVSEFNYVELYDFLEWLHQRAAENFNLIIMKPILLINE